MMQVQSQSGETQRHSQSPSRPQMHMHGNRPCSHNHSQQQAAQHSPHMSRSNSIPQSQSPTQAEETHGLYFEMLKDSYSTNRVFFWNEVLDGGATNHVISRYKLLSWVKILRKNYVQRFASMVLSFASQFLPNILKPFFAGFFLPLLGFLYVNWKLLELKVFTVETSIHKTLIEWLYWWVITMFVLVALVGGGTLSTDENKVKTQELLAAKPYMNNPRLVCATCEVLKGFRSQHCPQCKECIPKYSGHSSLFNRCIGASNQLLYLLFNLAVVCAQLASIVMFLVYAPEDVHISTKIVYVWVNSYVLWLALVKVLVMLVMNFWYNLTQHEVKNWMYQPYLLAFGKRQFLNPLNIGFLNNIKEAIYALFGLQEEQQGQGDQILQGSIIQPEESPKKYITNWAKVMYYNGSELRNHPNRRQIAMKLKEMENMMKLQTQIMDRVREQMMKQHKGKRPLEEINKIILMQTQYELQAEMQKRFHQRTFVQKEDGKITEKRQNQSQSQKAEESEPLISLDEDKGRDSTDAGLRTETEELLQP